MKLHHTVQCKIYKPTKNKKEALLGTIRKGRKILNHYFEYLSKYDLPSKSELHKLTYHKFRNIYPDYPAGLLQSIRDKAYEWFRSYRNNDDNKHFPCARGYYPLRYDNRCISIQKSKNTGFDFVVSISTIRGRKTLPLIVPEYYKPWFNQSPKMVDLLYKKGELYLNVIFEYEKEIPKEDKIEHIISIDVGINNAAIVSVADRNGNELDRKFFNGKRILEKRRHYSNLRKKLGQKKCVKKIKQIGNKEKRYCKDQNHKITSAIISFASKYSNVAVVFENLKGIRKKARYSKKTNRKIHGWPYHQFVETLKYKAHKNGMAYRQIYPAWTSSTCFACNSRNTVRNRHSFKCKECGKEAHVDLNGARNVGKRLLSYMPERSGRSGSDPKQESDETPAFAAPAIRSGRCYESGATSEAASL